MTHDEARQILIANQCAPDAPGASEVNLSRKGGRIFVTCETWNRHVAARRQADAELAEQRKTEARERLRGLGFSEGERVTMHAPSMLPGAPGRTYAGTVKISKWGALYVLARGERLCLERNHWQKTDA